MSKLKQSKQLLDDTEMLILIMNEEIKRLRNIILRQYYQNGIKLKSGEAIVPDDTDFIISGGFKECNLCILDCNDLGVKSNFMIIQELIKKLEL